MDTSSQQTLTYTIVNTGPTTLTLSGTPTSSGASNVSVDTISAPGSTSLGNSASTTFTVAYTVQAAGAFSFDLAILSNDADEGTYNITVSGTGLGTPDISVSSSTSGNLSDGSSDGQGGVATGLEQQLTYTIVNNSGTSLTLSSTPTVSGTSNATVNSVSTITPKTESAFLLDLDMILNSAGSFFYNVVPGQAYNTSFQFSLRAFMNRITAPDSQATASTPGGIARFDALSTSDASVPLSYATSATAQAAIDTDQIFAARQDATGAEPDARSGFDFWMEGSFAKVENGQNDSLNGIFFAGADYRLNDNALFGIIAELDISDETNEVAGTAADGIGWMAGPYAVVRLHQNLYFDGRVAYGQSYNRVNALGLFYDDFTTERLLLQAGLTGDFATSSVTFNPFARLVYSWENQKSYTDTLGNAIPDQTFDLGRLEFGPKISFAVPTAKPFELSLDLGVSGLYDFNRLQDNTPGNSALASSMTGSAHALKVAHPSGSPAATSASKAAGSTMASERRRSGRTVAT